MSQALRGRRILITRSRTQASALAAELERHGAIPLLVPTLDLLPPSSFQDLDAALATLSRFSWLVFTSANAVAVFAERARTLGIIPAPRHIAVIGPATATALAHQNIHPLHGSVLIPPTARAESLADALLSHLGPALFQQGTPEVLLVRAEQARDLLPEALLSAGVALTVATAYRTVLPAGSIDLLQTALANDAPTLDAVTFTSSSTARNLAALLEAGGLHLPPETLRISIGPITTETLRELGIPPHFEALEANIPSLVQAVLQAFAPASD